MKFLIVGLGSAGQRHLQNLAASGDHEYFSYRVRGNVLPDVPPFNLISSVDSLDEGLAKTPDATFICGPTSTHISVALEAARAGSNLFIEKPVSHNLERLDELSELVIANGLVSMVGLNLRFHAPLMALKQVISDGKIGRILGIRCQVGQSLPNWHADEDYRLSYSANKSLGGGVILDLIHEIDLAIWIAGLPSEISSFNSHVSDLEIDTEDSAEIIMRMPGGALANVHMDYVQSPASRSLFVYGEAGSIEWNGISDEVIYSPANGEAVQIWSSKQDRNQSFADLMNSFLSSITGDLQSAIPLSEGLKSQIVADAAYRSDQSGKSVNLAW